MMPFPGGLEATANGTLVLSIAAAVLYFFAIGRPPSWRRTSVKTAAVGLLALMAASQGGPMLLVAALAFSALGGGCLAQEDEKWLPGGLAAFLAAHLAYFALFAGAGGGPAILPAEPWRLAMAVLVALGTAATIVRLRRGLSTAQRLSVAVYAAAVVLMAAAALTVDRPLVIVGALLFVVSDAVLAIDRFSPRERGASRSWAPPTAWVLYYGGQLLIVLGALLPV